MTRREFYLYNTASRSKEKFVPLHDQVGMYCCGPTVYDYAHAGNMRTYIWEDALDRTIRALGFKLRHVMNITDVGHLTSDEDTGEDKMEKGARREGKTASEIAQFYTDAFMKDLKALNCRTPDVVCRATDHVPEMIDMIQKLKQKGFTYKTSDGIYFDTSKFPKYVEFARLDPEQLQAGSRIDMGEKRSNTDFALWKFSPKDTKRQMEWDSPWGVGFPGWHIECSAMSLKYLAQPIDIHCGGQEHIRVHHSNEIAQAEAATGKQFVRYWIHGEWVMFGNVKMSKSGGGIIRIKDIEDEGISPLAYRMFAFSAHHRSPLSFNWESLKGAAHGLKSLKKLVAESVKKAGNMKQTFTDEQVDKVLDPFWNAVCDDLNMPKAVAAVWDIVHDHSTGDALKVAAVERADAILGLDLLVPEKEDVVTAVVEKDGIKVSVISKEILEPGEAEAVAESIVARKKARASKDFQTADRIRNELTQKGYTVKDLPDGTVEVRAGT